MLNPIGLLDQAHLQHTELVRQAEKERLYRQLKGNRPGLFRQLLDHFKSEVKPLPARSITAPIPVYGKR